MPASSILAVNQNYLCDPTLDPVLSGIDPTDRKMLTYFCTMSADMNSTQIGLMPRTGVNMLPFKNDILPLIDAVMPEYDAGFDWTWEQVTDQRAMELQSLVEQGKELVVFWSGGIDSTCILVAILKNFHRHNLSQVRVACTCHGIIENPVFYHDHILPNFGVVDTNWFVTNEMMQNTQALVVEGFAADTLTMSMTPSLDVCLAVRQGQSLSTSWRKPDALIAYLTKVTGCKQFANWYYERNRESVESVDVPVETYFDFMWWIGFNCEYYSWPLHSWFFCFQHLDISFVEYQQKCLGWYRNDLYQLWAMNNNGPGVKHGTDLGSLKQHPKQYIYDYDHNPWYRQYKTKINSPGRAYNSSTLRPFAITDEFEILYLERDLDLILELLPTHVRS